MSRRTRELLNENNERERALTAEANAALTDIVVYLRASRLSEYEQELVRRDIAQMLLDGAARGQDAQEVIGGDYRQFCDDIIAAFPRRGMKERALEGVRDALLMSAVLLAIKTVSGALSSLLTAGSAWAVTVTLGDLISMALILAASCGIVLYICRSSFEKKALKGWQAFAALFAVMFAIMSASIFIKQPLFEMHTLLFALLPAAAFAGYKLLDARID